MTKTKIRICPFCGHHGQELERLETNWKGNAVEEPLYRIGCCCCGAKGPEELQKDWAIDSWNHIYRKPAHNDDPLERDFEYDDTI